MSSVPENKRMPLNECKKILNSDGLLYTDEEILKVRDFLYYLSDIVMDNIEKEKQKRDNKNNM